MTHYLLYTQQPGAMHMSSSSSGGGDRFANVGAAQSGATRGIQMVSATVLNINACNNVTLTYYTDILS
jgi:hypothetical protein